MSRPNIFSTAHETAIEILPSTDSADVASAVKNGFMSAFATLFKPAEKPKEKPQPAPANDNSFDIDKFATVLGGQIADAVKPANEAVAALGTRLDALVTQLAQTEQPNSFKRAPATGGNGTVQTDC
jgi:hypothetical protein